MILVLKFLETVTHLEVLCKKGVLRNFVKCTAKQGLFIIKENLPQVFCCELFEISMKIFFDRTLPVAASELLNHSDWNAYNDLEELYEWDTLQK